MRPLQPSIFAMVINAYGEAKSGSEIMYAGGGVPHRDHGCRAHGNPNGTEVRKGNEALLRSRTQPRSSMLRELSKLYGGFWGGMVCVNEMDITHYLEDRLDDLRAHYGFDED